MGLSQDITLQSLDIFSLNMFASNAQQQIPGSPFFSDHNAYDTLHSYGSRYPKSAYAYGNGSQILDPPPPYYSARPANPFATSPQPNIYQSGQQYQPTSSDTIEGCLGQLLGNICGTYPLLMTARGTEQGKLSLVANDSARGAILRQICSIASLSTGMPSTSFPSTLDFNIIEESWSLRTRHSRGKNPLKCWLQYEFGGKKQEITLYLPVNENVTGWDQWNLPKPEVYCRTLCQWIVGRKGKMQGRPADRARHRRRSTGMYKYERSRGPSGYSSDYGYGNSYGSSLRPSIASYPSFRASYGNYSKAGALSGYLSGNNTLKSGRSSIRSSIKSAMSRCSQTIKGLFGINQ